MAKRRFKKMSPTKPLGAKPIPPPGAMVSVRFEDWRSAYRDSVRYQVCRASQSQYSPEEFDQVVDAKIAEAAKQLMVTDKPLTSVVQ